MATNLNALTLRINANTEGVSKAVRAVRSDVSRVNSIMRQAATASDRAKQAQESLDRVYRTGAISRKEYVRAQRAIKKQFAENDSAAKKFRATLLKLTAAFAALRVASKATEKINQSFESIDKLAKSADKLGIATEKLGAYRLAAAETAGMVEGQFDVALQRMVRRTAEAAQGTGEAKNAIAELGLSAQQLGRMSPDRMFAAYADAFQKVESQSDRLRLAFKLFDSEGAGLVNTLRIGKAGLDEYEQSAKRLGVAVNRFDAAKIEAANDAYGRIRVVIDGLSNKIAIGLSPHVVALSERFVAMGESGSSAFNDISVRLDAYQDQIATAFDIGAIISRSLSFARAKVFEFMAWTARKFSDLSKMAERLLNKIPGIKTKSLEFTHAFADEMENKAKEFNEQWRESFSKPLPGQGIERYFARVKQLTAEMRKDVDATIKERELASKAKESVGSNGLEFGQQIANAFGTATQFVNKANQAITKPKTISVTVQQPESALKGSVAEFQLLRKMQQQKSQRELSQQVKQNQYLAQINQGIQRFAGLLPKIDTAKTVNQIAGKFDSLKTQIANLTGVDLDKLKPPAVESKETKLADIDVRVPALDFSGFAAAIEGLRAETVESKESKVTKVDLAVPAFDFSGFAAAIEKARSNVTVSIPEAHHKIASTVAKSQVAIENASLAIQSQGRQNIKVELPTVSPSQKSKERVEAAVIRASDRQAAQTIKQTAALTAVAGEIRQMASDVNRGLERVVVAVNDQSLGDAV